MARFIITGGLTATIDFVLLVLFVEVFSLYYLVAGGISFVVAVSLNYFISRDWVFTGGKYSHPVEFLGFFITSSIGLLLNQIVLWIFVDLLSLDYRISKVIAIFIVTFWNFATKKHLIFRN